MLRSLLGCVALFGLLVLPATAHAEYPDQFLSRGYLIECTETQCRAVAPDLTMVTMKDECDVFDFVRTPVWQIDQVHPALMTELVRLGHLPAPVPRPKPSS